MAAIGILGGMGPQASTHLHRLLVQNAPKHIDIKSDTDFPEIVLLSVPVPNFITDQKNMIKAKNMLVERTQLLEQAGCVVNGIACNTAHLLLPDLAASTAVPFVSIPLLVANKIERGKFCRVGLLATPITLRSTLYDNALPSGIKLIRPSNDVAERIEMLIFKELQGTRDNQDRKQLHNIVESFRKQNELDAVILGCTELPLVFGHSSKRHIIDTLQVLSEGLLAAFVIAQKGTA